MHVPWLDEVCRAPRDRVVIIPLDHPPDEAADAVGLLLGETQVRIDLVLRVAEVHAGLVSGRDEGLAIRVGVL